MFDETDFDQFVELLDAAYSLHSKTLPANAKALFFRSLDAYPLAVVRKALDAHVKDPQRGQFPPKPADLIAQIEGASGNDARPGPEEAWAIAVQAFDEASTVVLNEEIAEALGTARPIFEIGDEVGARMAFKEVYVRLVSKARASGVSPHWWPSLGSQVDARHVAIERAIVQGLLPASAPVVQSMLPAPADATPLLSAVSSKPEARKTLDALRKLLARDLEQEERQRQDRLQIERDAVDARKADLRDQAESRGWVDDGYQEMGQS